jgi:uncharacterized protein YybS (DUF2232 family)
VFPLKVILVYGCGPVSADTPIAEKQIVNTNTKIKINILKNFFIINFPLSFQLYYINKSTCKPPNGT